MILVTTGTNGAPFDRLLEVVCEATLDEELIVQHGPSAIRAERATNIEYLPFADLEALVQRSRLVITHGGVGSILLALMHGHRPVVVPRLARHGEAIDDHQLVLAGRLDELGLVSLVSDVSELVPTVETIDPALGELRVAGAATLAEDVRHFVDSLCDDRARSDASGEARRKRSAA